MTGAKPKSLLRYVAAGVLTLAFGQSVAVAQAPAPAEPAPGAAAPDVNAGLSRQVQLSPKEQLAQADADLARMESARDNVRRQLMAAREERDVVKTLCLNDKLTQLNVAVTSGQERRDALAAAVTRNDADLANHEYTIMSVLRQRGDQLAAEANQCIGEEAGFVGQSSVIMDVDKDLPEEDPSEFPKFGIEVEPPGCVSCFE